MPSPGSCREFFPKHRAEPFGKTALREQQTATIDFKHPSHRIPRRRVVENDGAMSQFVNRNQIVQNLVVAPTHILRGHVVTTLPNALSHALDGEFRAAESYVDDADTNAPRLLDAREMMASGDGGLDREALALERQVVPASNGKATGTKRCSFG